MTTKPTPDEVIAEAALLRAMAPLVRHHTFFGDDNRAAIGAQAEVLEKRMSRDDVYDRFEPDSTMDDEDEAGSQNELDCALSACEWLRGGSAEGKPSEGWAGLLPAGTALAELAASIVPGGGRQLVSGDQAVKAKCQHKTPCSDCPWARKALPGWLGDSTIDEWLQRAHHSNTQVECHTLLGAQCAGLAIYRSNVLKRVEAGILKLPVDKVTVFATPTEFREHHARGPGAPK